MPMKVGTNLEKILESGKFAVTAEAGPQKVPVPQWCKEKERYFVTTAMLST